MIHKTPMAETLDEAENNLFLLPCSICARTFRPEVLVRHESVCEKTITKKRKVFDSFKCRVQGTDLQEFLGPAPLPGQPQRPLPKIAPKQKTAPEKPKVPKWKQTHDALVATLRAARGEEVPSSTSATTITAVADSEQCPSCGRNFGPRAYDRHVEFCKEMMIRKARTPPKHNAAHERMQARIQYRAPLAIKRSRPDVTISKIPEVVGRPKSLPSQAHATPPVVHRRSIATAPAQREQPSMAAGSAQAGRAPSHSSGQRLPPATTPLRVPRSPSVSRRSDGGVSEKTTALTRAGSTRGSLRLRGVSPAKTADVRRQSVGERNLSIDLKSKLKKQPSSLSDSSDNSGSTALQNLTFSKQTMASINAAADQQMRDLFSWPSDNDLAAKPMPLHSRPPVDDNKTTNRSETPFTKQLTRSDSEPQSFCNKNSSTPFADLVSVCLRDLSERTNDNRSTPSPDESSSFVDSQTTPPLRHRSVKLIHPRSTPSPKANLPRIHNSPQSASPLHASPTSAFSPVASTKALDNRFTFDENDNSVGSHKSNNWSDNSSEEFHQLTSTPKPRPAPRTPRSMRKSAPAGDLNQTDNHLTESGDSNEASHGNNRRYSTPEKNQRHLTESGDLNKTAHDNNRRYSTADKNHLKADKNQRHLTELNHTEFDNNRQCMTESSDLNQAAPDNNRRYSTASLNSSNATLIDEGVLWAHLESQAQPVVRNRKKTLARSQSIFDNRNRMLYLETYMPHPVSSDEETADVIAAAHRPRTHTLDRKANHRTGYCVPQIESQRDVGGGDAPRDGVVTSGDSAYSSLNRRSPVGKDGGGPLERKLSTFCHECGGMYPVASAKFCCQCGVQRLYIGCA